MMADHDEHIENRGPVVLAVTTALLAVSTMFVALRLVSRAGVVRKVSQDDYFIVLAWVIAFGLSFSICYGTSLGLGRHEADLLPELRSPLKKCEYAFSVLYNPALMATKTSIGLFYLTLGKNQLIFKWSTIATLVVVNVAGLALTILNIVQCRPVRAGFETHRPPTASCTDIVTLYLSSAPVNIITDLALLFIPFPVLTSMRLPRNEKIILIITFSFGAFVAVVDVVRIAYLQSASVARLQEGSMAARDGDFSWIASLSFMWSAVEVHVGIICACVPGVKPLVARIFPNLLGRITSTGGFHGKSVSKQDDARWADVVQPTQLSSHTVGPSPSKPPVIAAEDGELGLTEFLTTPETKPEQVGMTDFLTTPETETETKPEQIEMTDFATTSETKPEQIGIMEFLSGPDSDAAGPTRKVTTMSNSQKSRVASLTVFDFVSVKNPKSMVKMSTKEAIGPLAFVTILFFLWGFAYGLLDVLNGQFQLLVGKSSGQRIGLHSAYFSAYFVSPVTFGRVVFKKWGFKATFITGLCIYACGTLVFWPSAVLASFPAFLISNFIVGLGIATLEVAGNPFIALCGPPQYAEFRLNISQAVQAIGTVTSPILARKVLFKGAQDAPSLIDIQWTYLGIALFDVILAVIFYYVPLPEASDEDLDAVAETRASVYRRKVRGVSVVYMTLGLGVFSQFCYVGGQEAVSRAFEQYVMQVKPGSAITPFDYQSLSHSAFTIGRLLSAMGSLFVKPRRILLLLFIGAIVTSALAMDLTADGGVAMIILISLFESGIFPITFAMCMRGLGARTKDGAILLTMATSGGAVAPAIMNAVIDSRGVRYAFCIVVSFFAFGIVFPIFTALVPAAKQQVDPVRETGKLPMPRERPSRAAPGSQESKVGLKKQEPISDFITTALEPGGGHESGPGEGDASG